MSFVFLAVSTLLGVAALSSILTLVWLLAAAFLAKRRPLPTASVPSSPSSSSVSSSSVSSSSVSSSSLSLAVIIPAHNEELVLAGTLDSLHAQNYPPERFEVVVVADNCTDTTAALARQYDVTVLERFHDTERGKGYALNFAVAHLLGSSHIPDGIVIVDADTWVAPDFLALMSTRLLSSQDNNGYGAWQGRYGVLNAGDGWRAALMAAAFDLVNHVKPLGREFLGLSVGLKGNGMAFTCTLAEALPWPGGSLTEDLDYSLEMARRFDLRVGYAPEARVRAQMPATSEQAASQRSRWERGRFGLIRERVLPLLGEALHRRSRLLLDMAWDLLIPPLAELTALLALWLVVIAVGIATHLLPHPLIWAGLGAVGVLGLLTYILGGLRVADAPPEAYAALARAPFYAAWKFALLLSGQRGKKANGENGEEWVRTARAPLAADAPSTPSQPSASHPSAEITPP